MSKNTAKEIVKKFGATHGPGVFVNISRKEIFEGLLQRIDYPDKINQGGSNLCGPASFLYNLASCRPEEYAKFTIELYEHGKANLGKLNIKPTRELMRYNLTDKTIQSVDWMTLASIRNSMAPFLLLFRYDSVDDVGSAITTPGDLESWFKKVGYKEIVNETWSLSVIKDYPTARKNAEKASCLLDQKGYKVCLLVHHNMLNSKTQKECSLIPGHWIVLNSPITITTKSVNFTVFTWGNSKFSVPQKGSLSEKDFLNNYFGFIACKY